MTNEMPVLCWTCRHRMAVPGSCYIVCAWQRGSRRHVGFYEGFDPNYPNPVTECEGYAEGDMTLEDSEDGTEENDD